MIKVEKIKKTYDRRTKNANTVLKGMSFELPESGFVCILGESGCGKTSLLNAIGGLDTFDSGRIITEDSVITRSPSAKMERVRNASFGYIFQNYYLLNDHSVAYNVYLGMHALDIGKKEKTQRVKEALKRVDMWRYRKRPVNELSGGQQQRVAIARAIARRPRVIFADEPTGNLDETNTVNICTLLKELSRDSLVLMVTHEERIARFFADRIITLSDGEIVSDTSDWQRGSLSAGAKDSVYAGDYEEERINSDNLHLRLLRSESTAPVSLTVVADSDRIVIKVNDQRIVLCSKEGGLPRIEEGKCPILTAESLSAQITESSAKVNTQNAKKRGDVGLRMLLTEAKNLVSAKKLHRAGAGIFMILLTAMLSFTIADVVTVAHIDPEDFISTDPHILSINCNRGPEAEDKFTAIAPNVNKYRDHIDASGLDFDYIPKSGVVLEYTDNTVSQLGDLTVQFLSCSWANVSRLDPNTIISGRMPERSDEIVIDRWVIDNLLSKDGIIQNVIPTRDYLLGKQLKATKMTYSPTIVGISDSGSPSIYMSTETLLAYASKGIEVMTLSEFQRLTGYDAIKSLEKDQCLVNIRAAGNAFLTRDDLGVLVRCDYKLHPVAKLRNVDSSIHAKLIIADDALEPLYRAVINTNNNFSLWCADKEAMYSYLDSPLPEELKGALEINVVDGYGTAYKDYEEKTVAKLDARTVIIVAVILSSVVMLYLMQRSKIREHMDLVAVYRLLGIPKSNLAFVFATESLLQTLKYALPSTAAMYFIFMMLSKTDLLPDLALMFPLWAAGLTLALIAIIRLIVAILPTLRLLSLPPARIAAKYDF